MLTFVVIYEDFSKFIVKPNHWYSIDNFCVVNLFVVVCNLKTVKNEKQQ